jgi:hypothetical protein
MHELEIRSNQIDYVGLLAQPAFSLWGEGKILLAALYAAFEPFNVKLSDFTGTAENANLADQEVSIRLGSGAVFRFRFDKVEARLANYREDELLRFPDIVHRGVLGLREAATDFTFASHFLAHASHSVIPGVTSREYLKALTHQADLKIGESAGHGYIFHFDVKERGWRVQLTLDHSLSVPDGIYIAFTVLVASDRLDYQRTFVDARELFNRCLSNVGLRISTVS